MARRTVKQKARYAARLMYPNRMTARLLSGGRHQTIGAWVRSYFRPPGPRSYRMADEPNLSDAQRLLPPSQRRGSAPRKAPAKKQSSYEAAKQIPARNQAVAKKAAAARRAAGGKKQQHVQGKGGRMQGSVTLPGADLTAYRRGVAGQVDPAQQVRRPRWPR